ncbi:hypothetical protein [Giesbergeria anulus]|uniref:DUF4124 domain-containing protein n=1 Tax=Giesbergeria anulus TaxID=180197 RepID=A0A1H9QBE2_9BURK|nr:hypothetical protein [Giesbergeria anulus]SER57495.1 hypothetical protein SAMN02982919_02607 [Giesbergeria anulus]
MTTKHFGFRVAAVLLLWGSLAGAPALGMNKCTSPNGGVTYQDDACTLGRAEKANIPHYTPPPPPGAAAVATAVVPVAGTAPPPSTPKAKAKGLPEDAVVHTGPRGGRYIILPTGKKRYLPKES